MLWQLFLVIGIICNALAVWGAATPFFPRAGWLFYVLAGVLWLLAPDLSSVPAHPIHLTL